MPNFRLIGAAVKPAIRHEQTDRQTDKQTDRQRIQIQRPLLSPVDRRGERANILELM